MKSSAKFFKIGYLSNSYHYGLHLELSINVNITGNTIADNGNSGILIDRSSTFNIIDNLVINNELNGIDLESSDDIYIFNNSVLNNTEGIFLSQTQSVIESNNIVRNAYYGVDLFQSNLNVILKNNFIENGGDNSQARDCGGNNVFYGNYWDEWENPSLPYLIDGSSGKQDENPRSSPHVITGGGIDPHGTPSHYLSAPKVIAPNSLQTISGITKIEWEISLDTFQHSIIYSVFYSSDGGATWNLIVANLYDTYLYWDTTTVQNGFSYLIKVEVTCSWGETSYDESDEVFSIQNPENNPSPPAEASFPAVLLSISSFLLIYSIRKSFFSKRN